MYINAIYISNIYDTISKKYYPKNGSHAILVLIKRLQNERELIFMKQIKQLFWIFLFSLIGEVISALLSQLIAIPGSVVGMVLLFCALHFKWIKMEQVNEVGTWLTNNMGIFFVPAGVGLMSNFGVLANTWWQLLVIMAITTMLMMGVVGRIVQAIKSKELKAETNTTDSLEEIEVEVDVI